MLARRLIGAGYAVEVSEGPGRARELAAAGGVRLAVLAPGDFGAAGADLARELRAALARSGPTLIEVIAGDFRPHP